MLLTVSALSSSTAFVDQSSEGRGQAPAQIELLLLCHERGDVVVEEEQHLRRHVRDWADEERSSNKL